MSTNLNTLAGAAALQWFLRSAELARKNPNTRMCLAAAYALLGDKTNAVKQMTEFRRPSGDARTRRSRAGAQSKVNRRPIAGCLRG
jgi:hypothetical protein